MIRTSERIEYLDHNFTSPQGGGIYTCEKCKLYVCIYMCNLHIKECVYLADKWNHHWEELKLTCDEQIIKNIIE
jgi:hypothetical protein